MSSQRISLSLSERVNSCDNSVRIASLFFPLCLPSLRRGRGRLFQMSSQRISLSPSERVNSRDNSVRIASLFFPLCLPSFRRGRGRLLYQWQTDTIYLLIDVERIDICHSTDEVEDCHDTCFKTRTLDVILA